jgi:hypothetical protein
MTILFVLAGSLAGFVCGLSAFMFFDAGLLAAVAIWVAAGPLAALMALVQTFTPTPARAAEEGLTAGKVA